MSQSSSVCRLCLSVNVLMVPIAGTPVQRVYENLIKTALPKAEPCPEKACFICHAELLKCNTLMQRAIEAHTLLENILERKHTEGPTDLAALIGDKANSLRASLCISPVDYTDSTSFNAPVYVVVKNEPYPKDAAELDIEFQEDGSQPPIADGGDSGAVTDDKQSTNIAVQQRELKIECEEAWKEAASTSKPAEKQTVEKRTSSTARKKYECKTCRRKFIEKFNLQVHLLIHSGDEPKKKLPTHSGEKPFKCELCQHSFHQKHYLQIHMKTHNNEHEYSCDVCQRKFDLKIDYLAHKGAIYECNDCQRQFIQKRSLLRHIKRNQCNIPPAIDIDTHLWTQRSDNFECNICHRMFRRLNYVKRHLKTHIGAKPHKCEFCDRRFEEHYSLKRHFRVHTGERPYECNICEKRFRQHNNLTDHLRRHTSEKSNQCDICQRPFLRQVDLKRHLITHVCSQ